MAPRPGEIEQNKLIFHPLTSIRFFLVLFSQASEPSLNFDISKMANLTTVTEELFDNFRTPLKVRKLIWITNNFLKLIFIFSISLARGKSVRSSRHFSVFSSFYRATKHITYTVIISDMVRFVEFCVSFFLRSKLLSKVAHIPRRRLMNAIRLQLSWGTLPKYKCIFHRSSVSRRCPRN